MKPNGKITRSSPSDAKGIPRYSADTKAMKTNDLYGDAEMEQFYQDAI